MMAESAITALSGKVTTVSTDVTALNASLQGDEIALFNSGVPGPDGLTTETAKLLLDAFQRRLEDARYGPLDLGTI